MALSRVPDSVLEKLRCSCGRYLSSAPVIACQDGQNVCSKCVATQPPQLGAVTQNVVYEALAGLFKFPCSYKPQGCFEYVEFNKASEHEDECLHRVYECPVNLLSSCSKSGTAAELYVHYENNHPDMFLKEPTFAVNVTEEFEFHRLFKIEDVLLLLQSKCSINAGKLWFNTIYFGNVVNASLIRYSVKLSNADDKKRVMELEQVSACSINNILMLPSQYVEVDISTAVSFLNNSKLQCQWAVQLPEGLNDKLKNQEKLELEKIFQNRKESIRCPCCGIFMVPPIYRCDQNHITCVDCRGYDDQCRSCLKINAKFIIAADLEQISKSGMHNCKWKICQQQFSYDMIRSHEQECFYRVYRCPECSWSGIYDMFLNHFKNVHRDVNICIANAVNLNLQNCPRSYIVVHRDIFKFEVVSQVGFGVQYNYCDINVYFLGLPTYANYWKYEVKDNLGIVYNFSGNQYTATVRITNTNPPQTPWKCGTFYGFNEKMYALYITKQN